MIEKKLSNATPLDDENVVLRRSDKKELANVSLSNLNEVGEKHFLNKTQITNCILEAPNGVAELAPDGYNFILKQGLKVLIPNGRNADGTLKNIEVTLNKDETYTGFSSSTASRYYLFVDDLGDAYAVLRYLSGTYANMPTVSDSQTILYMYYAIDTNKMYLNFRTTGKIWKEIKCAVVAEYTRNSGITSLTPYQPVELAKQQDIDGMWTNSEKALLYGVSITNTAGVAIDVSDYLPNDGNIYEVLCRASLALPANSTAGYRDLIVYSDLDFGSLVLSYTATAPAPKYKVIAQCINFIQIVGPGRYMAYYRTAGYSAEMEVTLVVYGYRKVR